ncbi:molybdopterin molybdenumtransferase MoeA [Aureimonas endophytica]|uniref:Molybdopterin molybdenumtransferase n=1 Tax=Aureimonas endophytica TaxID=2027858 RepID=A0A916ZDC2_9HYPH|nr:gephyrin-like molybdotransferase Glp [Aureimonas endophytica]GGD89317.1 molybdopterin molybdenumtransferase MoeA [Aureimonas endophytica]
MSLIPVEEAFRRIVGDAAPIGDTETLPLGEAFGRVLARDLPAGRSQPGFDASAMDGYALRSEDIGYKPEPLRIVGESAAGRAFEGRCDTGDCVRIFTGAPMPDGADAVLIQENAERLADGRLLPRTGVKVGQHVRRAGIDFQAGDILVPARGILTAGRIALAASGSHPTLDVVRRPRVAILATGDELVPPGAPVGPSQIVASNSFGIAGLVRAAGGEPLDYGIAPDAAETIGRLVDRAVAERVDILVTIGGASVGDHDLIGPVFASRGVALDFWKLAMRPGKPLMAGRLGPLRLLGLPGNPASSMVTATLFLQPLVRALLGLVATIPYREGILGADMVANDERADFIRATIGDSTAVVPIVSPFGRQDSSLLSVFARADALLLREPHAPAAKAGEPCRFIVLG